MKVEQSEPTESWSGVYAITDDNLLPSGALLPAVEAALESGISLLQYRSKQDSWEQRVVTAKQIQHLCQRYQVPLLINDDVELCKAAGASGVHLGQDDGSVSAARADLGPEAIIGVTCHASLDAAVAAEHEGASYAAFGRFFDSSTKPQAPPAALEILTRAKQKLSIPIVAIGGINAENGAAVLAAGADILAVIHSIFGYQNIAENCQRLNALFSEEA